MLCALVIKENVPKADVIDIDSHNTQVRDDHPRTV